MDKRRIKDVEEWNQFKETDTCCARDVCGMRRLGNDNKWKNIDIGKLIQKKREELDIAY